MTAGALTDPDRVPAPPQPPEWNEALRGWVLSAHADVSTVLRLRSMAPPDPRAVLARVEARTGRPYPHLAAVLEGTMLFQSGPRHAATRQAMRLVLSAMSRRWTRAALRDEAGAILAALPDHATMDVASGLAEELPCRIAAEMTGLDPERLRRLRGWSQQATAVWRPLASLREYARLDALCAQAHQDMDAAGLSLPGVDPNMLGKQAADLVMFLVIAAVDATTSSIAAGLDLLSRDPALQVRLRAEPGLVDAFVAETLRLAGPLRRISDRIAVEPVAVGGVEITAGTGAVLQVDRAHRDPAVYRAPHRIDLDRADGPTLGFGGGAHACQGAVLGQAQVAAMLGCVVERFAISPAPGPRALADDPILRRYQMLPLRLARRG